MQRFPKEPLNDRFQNISTPLNDRTMRFIPLAERLVLSGIEVGRDVYFLFITEALINVFVRTREAPRLRPARSGNVCLEHQETWPGLSTANESRGP